MYDKNPEWEFDDECPECGEDTHLAAVVESEDEDGVQEATLSCMLEETGCGHTWTWERSEGGVEA